MHPEIDRDGFYTVENELVSEMKALGKPFIVILNSVKPNSQETQDLAEELTNQYGVKVLPVNFRYRNFQIYCSVF